MEAIAKEFAKGWLLTQAVTAMRQGNVLGALALLALAARLSQ